MAALLSAWEAAQEHVLPPAEDAMEAIGRFLATDAPEVLRDRLVPRLVEAFEERARGRGRQLALERLAGERANGSASGLLRVFEPCRRAVEQR